MFVAVRVIVQREGSNTTLTYSTDICPVSTLTVPPLMLPTYELQSIKLSLPLTLRVALLYDRIGRMFDIDGDPDPSCVTGILSSNLEHVALPATLCEIVEPETSTEVEERISSP